MVPDEFGRSVSISGESVIVGAYSDNNGAARQGSAYIFTRSGTVWTQQAKLVAPDPAANDFFGWSVAISDDRAVVGANAEDTTPNVNNGVAFVFVRTGTTWTQQSRLMAADTDSGDEFGFSVAIDGGRIAVGADEKNLGTTSSNGAVYIFTDTSAPVVNTRGALFDYDDDGKTDLSVFRPSQGAWYLQQSTTGFFGMLFGFSTDKIAPADYDGDGKTDIAVFRPSDQRWYIANSSNGTFSTFCVWIVG